MSVIVMNKHKDQLWNYNPFFIMMKKLPLNLSLLSSFSLSSFPPPPSAAASSSVLRSTKFGVKAVNLVSSAAQLQTPASVQCSFQRADQTLKKLHQKENKKQNNHNNNKEKKPRGGSRYKLPVFSAPALNAPVFAVISPGRAASEFLRSARPLSHPTSVRPVDAIAEPSPSPP